MHGGGQQSASPTALSSIVQSLENPGSLGLGMSVSLYTQASQLLLPQAQTFMYFLSVIHVI